MVENTAQRHATFCSNGRPTKAKKSNKGKMFEPLSKENLRQIVQIQFRQIQDRLKEQGIILEATEEALLHIAEEGYEPTMGARPLKRVMQKRILNELSKQILGNYITKDSVVMMELGNDGNLKFENLPTSLEIQD
jgi:ATP-dependent Clp protease ATP-binding subunit ClpB